MCIHSVNYCNSYSKLLYIYAAYSPSNFVALLFSQINDEALELIGTNCPHLVTLNVYGCKVLVQSRIAWIGQ